MDKSRTQVKLLVYMTLPILYPVCIFHMGILSQRKVKGCIRQMLATKLGIKSHNPNPEMVRKHS